jgi:hypothetical protein
MSTSVFFKRSIHKKKYHCIIYKHYTNFFILYHTKIQYSPILSNKNLKKNTNNKLVEVVRILDTLSSWSGIRSLTLAFGGNSFKKRKLTL